MAVPFDNVGSLFGSERAGVGFMHAVDGDSVLCAFAWPSGDFGAWATLTESLDMGTLPKEYLDRVLRENGFYSESQNPDYDPLEDFKSTAGENYQVPLAKLLLREQLGSRYLVANHYPTLDRAHAELSAFVEANGGTHLPREAFENAMGREGIRALLIPTDKFPREVTISPDADGSTLHSLQTLVGGLIEPFDVVFPGNISLYVNEEGLFSCPPNRAIYATRDMAEAGYLSQLDYRTPVKEGDFYTVLMGDIVATGFNPETGETVSLSEEDLRLVQDYFSQVSKPGSGMLEVLRIQSGKEPKGYTLESEARDMEASAERFGEEKPTPGYSLEAEARDMVESESHLGDDGGGR